MQKVNAHIGAEKYKTVVKGKDVSFVADQAISEGGANLGPSPKELLAGSLAACVAMTVRMYADRSNWPLDEVLVEVEIDTDTKPGTTIFRKKVDFVGDLSEEQLKRLHLIAQKCPINKLLQNPISIES